MEHPGTKRLETERLLLRPFAPADAESCIRNWAADPAVYRYISQEPQTPEQVRGWLAAAEEAYANPETRYWAVVERTGGEVIGEIFVDDFSARNGWCDVVLYALIDGEQPETAPQEAKRPFPPSPQ